MPSNPAQRAIPSPYESRTPTGDAAERSRTDVPFIVNPPRVDAFNWLRRVARIFAPSGGRTFVRTTDDSFQEQRAPLRIPRALFSGMGKTGPNTNILQDTGSWAYIPGQDISLKSAGRAVPMLRTIDDGVSIPAVYAGNPSQGV